MGSQAHAERVDGKTSPQQRKREPSPWRTDAPALENPFAASFSFSISFCFNRLSRASHCNHTRFVKDIHQAPECFVWTSNKSVRHGARNHKRRQHSLWKLTACSFDLCSRISCSTSVITPHSVREWSP